MTEQPSITAAVANVTAARQAMKAAAAALAAEREAAESAADSEPE